MKQLPLILLLNLVSYCLVTESAHAEDFERDLRPLLRQYCEHCHGEEDASADKDFTRVDLASPDFDLWQTVVGLINDGIMPPADEPQLSAEEKAKFSVWYQALIEDVQPHPGIFRPRRLSAHEYRNTLHSILGFPLEVLVMEAEQTVIEKSLVMKLLPTDPPGPSGFKNDTSANPLTTVIWDQYSYLIDNALERLFALDHRDALEAYTGKIHGESLSHEQAKELIRAIARRAYRRPINVASLQPAFDEVESHSGAELNRAVQMELKTILMSPKFLYRGLLMDGPRDSQRPVDDFELAERLSYFIWADMPDEQLMDLANQGLLHQSDIYHAQIDRMLSSPKARSLAETMGVEWFSLNEIDHVNNNPPVADALKRQPIDFLNYLFIEDRPLVELIDSKTTFINPHTAKYYPADRRQMAKYTKQRGIEVEAVPNQKISLDATRERGGLLTMPGVLAMNKGPVLRGTWILDRILGEHLPDPPANVGQVPANKSGENLTFRQRFEQHRRSEACAACHDKIDPLGFALESYGPSGALITSINDKARGKNRKADRNKPQPSAEPIDTSGQLPGGERFKDFQQLKQILVTTQKRRVVRNIVRRTMAYSLCRKLTVYDREAVEAIVGQLEEDGTFGEMIHLIADSLPFRETVLRSHE
ncbi:MAG: DUF1592 domain-containing protein [Planctomycetota bacterium]